MLGMHREYIPLLREEIQTVEQENMGNDLPLKKLRLMDSFLRETSRLNPLDGRKYNYHYEEEGVEVRLQSQLDQPPAHSHQRAEADRARSRATCGAQK